MGSIDLKIWIGGLLLAGGVWDDLRSKKIRNSLILGIFAAALVTLVATSGFSSLWSGASAFAAAFIFALPLYHFKVLGGGDFKLILAVSPLLNWESILVMIISSFFWGALFGIIKAALNGKLPTLLHNLFLLVTFKKPNSTELQYLPYSVALLFGWLSQYAFLSAGGRWI